MTSLDGTPPVAVDDLFDGDFALSAMGRGWRALVTVAAVLEYQEKRR